MRPAPVPMRRCGSRRPTRGRGPSNAGTPSPASHRAAGLLQPAARAVQRGQQVGKRAAGTIGPAGRRDDRPAGFDRPPNRTHHSASPHRGTLLSLSSFRRPPYRRRHYGRVSCSAVTSDNFGGKRRGNHGGHGGSRRARRATESTEGKREDEDGG